MGSILLSDKQLEIIKDLLKEDIEDMANKPEFLEQDDINPKEYIDERIELCKLFDIDFWYNIDLMCSHFEFNGLKAIYNGQLFKDYVASYEIPTQAELVRDFARVLFKPKKDLSK